jgi:hypothetical protein
MLKARNTMEVSPPLPNLVTASLAFSWVFIPGVFLVPWASAAQEKIQTAHFCFGGFTSNSKSLTFIFRKLRKSQMLAGQHGSHL